LIQNTFEIAALNIPYFAKLSSATPDELLEEDAQEL
jgi:hypothetical protein